MAECNLVAAHSRSRSAPLNVKTHSATAEYRVVRDINLVLRKCFHHDATALEVCESGVPQKAIRIHGQDTCAIAVVDCVALEVTFIDFKA